MSARRVLLLDHRDSFVHLLADQIARLGCEVDVMRTGMPLYTWTRCLERQAPDLVVLSPGPGHPAEAGLAVEWLQTRPNVPVFGVCLGHQIIGMVAGAEVRRGDEPAHGEACEILWHDQPFATPLPQRMPVARYHSLVVVEPRAPLRTLATGRDRGSDVVMAIEHTELPQIGVQFHPESVLTPHGQLLLQNVLDWAGTRALSVETN
ncbi:MAG: aminodeoxychorismate/anthranilate synthase component II [Planctomycetota bacterium]|nr:aminodeoxychorismate/anthranilate synthase component II [Planctomycetota bacterium]